METGSALMSSSSELSRRSSASPASSLGFLERFRCSGLRVHLKLPKPTLCKVPTITGLFEQGL